MKLHVIYKNNNNSNKYIGVNTETSVDLFLVSRKFYLENEIPFLMLKIINY